MLTEAARSPRYDGPAREERLSGQFASAGLKRLPPRVSRCVVDLALVSDYFADQAAVRGAYEMASGGGGVALDGKGEHRNTCDLTSFTEMAEKGLFSFDIESHVRLGTAYVRVASPEHPLTLAELPAPVRVILSGTMLTSVWLREHSRVPYTATLLF